MRSFRFGRAMIWKDLKEWSRWFTRRWPGYVFLVYLLVSILNIRVKVMEQVEGGDLIVNKGRESKPRENGAQRDMNAVEGLDTAFRLAEVICFHYTSTAMLYSRTTYRLTLRN